MAEGHGRDRWSRAAMLMMLIANANRDPKKGRAARLTDFNPYLRADKYNVVPTKEQLTFMREAFEKSFGKPKTERISQ
jgi:hypothetical protein